MSGKLVTKAIVFDGQTHAVSLKFRHMAAIEDHLGDSMPAMIGRAMSFRLVAEMTYQVVQMSHPKIKREEILDGLQGPDFLKFAEIYSDFINAFLGIEDKEEGEDEKGNGEKEAATEPPRMMEVG